jgi:hypothetical protein
MISETIDPAYVKYLLETNQLLANTLTGFISRLTFDDSNRPYVRVGFIDDGYVRVRDTSASIDILDMLRSFSWVMFNQVEVNKLISDLRGALSSVASDSIRVIVVTTLPESPFNITKVAGTSLTGRDWSQDFAKLQNLDAALSSRASESTLSSIAGALASRATDKLRVSVVDSLPRSPFTLYDSAGNELSSYVKNFDTALSSFTGSAGSSPPSKGVAILGFDGTYLRLLKTTTDGKLLAVLG